MIAGQGIVYPNDNKVCEYDDCENKGKDCCNSCTENIKYKSYYIKKTYGDCNNSLCIYHEGIRNKSRCTNTDYLNLENVGSLECSGCESYF